MFAIIKKYVSFYIKNLYLYKKLKIFNFSEEKNIQIKMRLACFVNCNILC